MNDDVIQDLKQFIETTVSQQLTLQTEELRSEMNQRFDKVDQRFEEVDLKQDEILNAVGGQLHDHEKRITRLETKAA